MTKVYVELSAQPEVTTVLHNDDSVAVTVQASEGTPELSEIDMGLE